jgi:hypothetical protein
MRFAFHGLEEWPDCLRIAFFAKRENRSGLNVIADRQRPNTLVLQDGDQTRYYALVFELPQRISGGGINTRIGAHDCAKQRPNGTRVPKVSQRVGCHSFHFSVGIFESRNEWIDGTPVIGFSQFLNNVFADTRVLIFECCQKHFDEHRILLLLQCPQGAEPDLRVCIFQIAESGLDRVGIVQDGK